MNYTELKNAIQAYTNNTESEFVANLDRFIRMAERRIYTEFELPAARKNVTTTVNQNDRFLQLPADVIAILDVKINSNGVFSFLRQKDEGFVREAYPDLSVTGKPLFFNIYDHSSIELGPVPDAAYTVELAYHGVPTSIVDATTTWLGDQFEPLLLYACLYEAYVFMKGDADIIAEYKERYKEEAIKANKAVMERIHAGNYYEGRR